MKYLLDSDTLIYFLKGEAKVVDRVASLNPGEMGVSIFTHAELFYGAYYSARKKANLKLLETFFKEIEILPFCSASSKIFAAQKAKLRQSGKMIADFDLGVASIALCRELIVVTNNGKHFERIQGLKIENWRV